MLEYYCGQPLVFGYVLFCYTIYMLLKYPVIGFPISQPFGLDNTTHTERGTFYTLFDNKHPGVDFAVPENTPIYASFEGIVVRKEFHKGMGIVIGIRNGNVVALYAHLNEFKVTLGEIAHEGGLIGLSGNTGSACLTPHLHFELRDITKPSLKEMVFEPRFNEYLSSYNNVSYKETFIYTVNNKNTKKTLKSLSKLYFGTDAHWQKIRDSNIFDYDGDLILNDGDEIKIPNYTLN